MNEVLTYGAEIGAVLVGYGAGQGVEQLALNHIKQSRAKLMEGHGDVNVSDLSYGGSRRFMAGLALVGAIAGYTAARGFLPNESAPVGEAPVVSAAVDYDFISSTDGTASIDKNLIERFDQNPRLDTKLYLANDGNVTTFKPVTNAELNKTVPYGPTTISAAVSSNLANGFTGAPKEQSNLVSKSNSISGAELIMDDNNSLGDTSSIINAAKNAGNIPIYIVNNETANPNPKNVQELTNIASATNGQYWAVTDQTANKVLAEMDSAIKPHEQTKKPNDDRLPWKIVSGALALSGFVLFRQRRKSTVTSPASSA